MRLHRILLPAVCLLLLTATTALVRKWTDQTGKYTSGSRTGTKSGETRSC